MPQKDGTETESFDLNRPPGSINEERGFRDVDSQGNLNPKIEKARADFLLAARNQGLETQVARYGAASMAAEASLKGRKFDYLRRIFLRGVGTIAVATIADYAARQLSTLIEVLEQEEWIPWLSNETMKLRRAAEKSRQQVISAADWKLLEDQVESAIRARNFHILNAIIQQTADPRIKVILLSVSRYLQGFIGEADALSQAVRSNTQFLIACPDNLKFYVFRRAANISSGSGDPVGSLNLWTDLHGLDSYKRLSNIERVGLWRQELNHCMQTVRSPREYYNAASPALNKYDKLLTECLKYTGHSLESAKHFHPVVGPAVISQKEYRDVIRYLRSDHRKATAALEKQRRAIEFLCTQDLAVGPIRFSPLVNQHIRARNWVTARELLDQQEQIWLDLDPKPHHNNRVEWGINRILRAIVEGYGFSKIDAMAKYLMEADRALKSSLTIRFQHVIVSLHQQMKKLRDGTTDKITQQLNAHLLAKSTDYYFFGMD